LASRSRARRLRDEVVAEIYATKGAFTVDLTDVLSISDSFADEFFAVLAQDYGDVWFRDHLRVEGACDVVRGAIVRAIAARLERATGTLDRSSSQGYELAPPPAHL
jgi:hypothetical protein